MNQGRLINYVAGNEANLSHRKIIHVDMDAFFASVEQRENPELKGRPVAVGGKANMRGVISTASYEARKFGVHSAMPTSRALQLCPDLILLPPNFNLYREISSQIREIMAHYSDIIEPVSIDEAYIEVTNSLDCQGSATRIAKSIINEIKEATQLTASAGVSYNKFLSKIASSINKPNGVYTITPQQAVSFINQLPIEKFHGIGPVTAKKLNECGVFIGEDIKKIRLIVLQSKLGKIADFLYSLANGIDNRELKTEQIRKSFASEITFSHDLVDRNEIWSELEKLLKKSFNELHHKKLIAKTITLKIKYSNFKQQTKSYSSKEFITSYNSADIILRALFDSISFTFAIRLVGISFSNLHNKEQKTLIQLRLFD